MKLGNIWQRFGFVVLVLIAVFSVKQVALADDEILMRTMDSVNLRTGPSTDHFIITTLDFGTQVTVVEYVEDKEEGWSQVFYDGFTGYIKSEFIGTEDMFVEFQETMLSQAVAGAELLQWSEVKNVFSIGVPAAVYDVYTGITYCVKSFSNGMHADVEPITKEDTALMKETFGNIWSWDVRPVLVTINGRTLAGSINGMPHGGGINNSNGMDGQVCIHFKGSKTHNGNSDYTKLHQDVLHIAYELSK